MKYVLRNLVFITLLISSSGISQELEGKWVISGNKSFGGFPGIHLMQVSEDSLSHYNFDQFVTKTSYKTENNKLRIDTLAFADFSFKNPNRLSISSKRLEKPVDYIRLVPTETNLSTNEIKQIKYVLERGGESFEVDFLNHPDSKIMHSYLKRIDNTYFLTVYRYGNIVAAMPIERITGDNLYLYGLPNGTSKLTARRKK